jgi:nucleoid DNA-binding protein
MRNGSPPFDFLVSRARVRLKNSVAGEAVRVSGLGVFNVAARPAREGRNPRTGESIEIAASKAVRFHAGKAVKDALNPPTPKAAPRKKSAPPKSAVRK